VVASLVVPEELDHVAERLTAFVLAAHLLKNGRNVFKKMIKTIRK
jgi:hypothetical protein